LLPGDETRYCADGKDAFPPENINTPTETCTGGHHIVDDDDAQSRLERITPTRRSVVFVDRVHLPFLPGKVLLLCSPSTSKYRNDRKIKMPSKHAGLVETARPTTREAGGDRDNPVERLLPLCNKALGEGLYRRNEKRGGEERQDPEVSTALDRLDGGLRSSSVFSGGATENPAKTSRFRNDLGGEIPAARGAHSPRFNRSDHTAAQGAQLGSRHETFAERSLYF
jgi:hypothetical protein